MLLQHIWYAGFNLHILTGSKDFSESSERKICPISMPTKHLWPPIAFLNSQNTSFVPLLKYQFIPWFIALCILAFPTACKHFEVMKYTQSFFDCPVTPIPGVSKCLWDGWKTNKNNGHCYFSTTIPKLNLANSYWHVTDFRSKVLCTGESRRVMHIPEWMKDSDDFKATRRPFTLSGIKDSAWIKGRGSPTPWKQMFS